METVQIYYYEKYDVPTHIMTRSTRPATREAIARTKGKLLKSTVQTVDSSSVDAAGYLIVA